MIQYIREFALKIR